VLFILRTRLRVCRTPGILCALFRGNLKKLGRDLRGENAGLHLRDGGLRGKAETGNLQTMKQSTCRDRTIDRQARKREMR
jgi:hypothetical protein